MATKILPQISELKQYPEQLFVQLPLFSQAPNSKDHIRRDDLSAILNGLFATMDNGHARSALIAVAVSCNLEVKK